MNLDEVVSHIRTVIGVEQLERIDVALGTTDIPCADIVVLYDTDAAERVTAFKLPKPVSAAEFGAGRLSEYIAHRVMGDERTKH